MTELVNTKVRCETGLRALFADATDAYACHFDHGDAVLTIADAAYQFPSQATDEPGYIGLLREGGCNGRQSFPGVVRRKI